ncbi:MAG: DUF2797 domain-containing protein [Bacteroidales bacterium]
MRVEYGESVYYYLPLSDDEIFMNDLLGHNITLEFTGQINCIKCGRLIKRSFAQGYCYPCFISVPETDDCILRPELCLAHEGISRDMDWSAKHCLQDHYVYLALSSAIKVGVTRASQVPTRWIDQGAWKALPIAKTPNRFLAGTIEVFLKNHLTDKTNWRHMLLNKLDLVSDLLFARKKIESILPDEMYQHFFSHGEVFEINYPVNVYPAKVKSVSFDKRNIVSEKLAGIRGQYLIFENGEVLNIRKHGGYMIMMTA